MLKTITQYGALLLGLLLLAGCTKTENKNPRFIEDACVVCSPYGHEKDAGKCFNCRGDGICKFCDGRGKRLLGTKDKFYEDVCAFCQGNGKCHYCTGSGKCRICGGTGKYAPLRPQKAAPQVQETVRDTSQ
jgi:hypothetical protein